MTEEAMLFRRVQEGCWEAFDVLFHTYAEQLFFYAMGFVNNREEARDIVQGTFITLWEQRGKIQCTGAIYPYLLRLVKNACLNYQVHEKVKERYLLEKRMTEEKKCRQMRRRSLRCNMPVCGKWWMVCRRNAGKFLFWDA